MTGKEYQERSAAIRKREEIIRGQIDGIIEEGLRPSAPVLRPLIARHQRIIDELSALDRDFADNA